MRPPATSRLERAQNIHGPQIEGRGTTRNTALKIETW